MALDEVDGARGGIEPRGARAFEALVALAVLVGLTLALYWPALRLGWFALDDARYVRENPLLAELSVRSLWLMVAEPYFMNWSPTHLLSYALDRALGGPGATTFHLSSVLWAGAGAFLLWVLARRVLATRSMAWIAALCFLAHPAHVEAIAWISSRKDLVATAFALAATVVWVRHAERPRASTWALAFALFALAVLGKLSVAVLPGVLLAWDLFVAGRRGLAPWLDKLPLVFLAGWVAWRVAGVQPETNVERDLAEHARVLLAFFGLASGFGEQVVFRPEPLADLSAVAALGGALALALGPVALLARARGPAGRLALVLWIWFLLALLPSQVLRFVYPVSDRYLYYPSAALALLVGLGLERLGARAPALAKLAPALGLALALAWGVRARAYLEEWIDPRSLWFHAARREPGADALRYLAQHDLAAADRLALGARGGIVLGDDLVALAGALSGPERAERLRRELAGPPGERPLSTALEHELVLAAREALERAGAHQGERALPELHHARGEVLLRLGEPREALAAFERARVDAVRHPFPFVSEPYQVLAARGAGLAAERLGELELALRLLRKARADGERFSVRDDGSFDQARWMRGLDEDLARVEAAVEGAGR